MKRLKNILIALYILIIIIPIINIKALYQMITRRKISKRDYYYYTGYYSHQFKTSRNKKLK